MSECCGVRDQINNWRRGNIPCLGRLVVLQQLGNHVPCVSIVQYVALLFNLNIDVVLAME